MKHSTSHICFWAPNECDNYNFMLKGLWIQFKISSFGGIRTSHHLVTNQSVIQLMVHSLISIEVDTIIKKDILIISCYTIAIGNNSTFFCNFMSVIWFLFVEFTSVKLQLQNFNYINIANTNILLYILFNNAMYQ